jgi:hypothetical protein
VHVTGTVPVEGGIMYVNPNFVSKAALKRAIAAGERVTVFAPGLGSPRTAGVETIEGPRYPKPHTWYAQVEVKLDEGEVIVVNVRS